MDLRRGHGDSLVNSMKAEKAKKAKAAAKLSVARPNLAQRWGIVSYDPGTTHLEDRIDEAADRDVNLNIIDSAVDQLLNFSSPEDKGPGEEEVLRVIIQWGGEGAGWKKKI